VAWAIYLSPAAENGTMHFSLERTKDADGEDTDEGFILLGTSENSIVLSRTVTYYNGTLHTATGAPYIAVAGAQKSRQDVGIGVPQVHKLVSGFERVAPSGFGYIAVDVGSWVFGGVIAVNQYGQKHKYFVLSDSHTISARGVTPTNLIAAIRYE
jgi:hypothetical protein